MPDLTSIALPQHDRFAVLTNQLRRSDKLSQIEQRATEMLESHPHFRGRAQWVQCRCHNRRLYLVGKVPSFYLKQLAQEAIRDLDDVDLVVNCIEVAGSAIDMTCCISASRNVSADDEPNGLRFVS